MRYSSRRQPIAPTNTPKRNTPNPNPKASPTDSPTWSSDSDSQEGHWVSSGISHRWETLVRVGNTSTVEPTNTLNGSCPSTIVLSRIIWRISSAVFELLTWATSGTLDRCRVTKMCVPFSPTTWSVWYIQIRVFHPVWIQRGNLSPQHPANLPSPSTANSKKQVTRSSPPLDFFYVLLIAYWGYLIQFTRG